MDPFLLGEAEIRAGLVHRNSLRIPPSLAQSAPRISPSEIETFLAKDRIGPNAQKTRNHMAHDHSRFHKPLWLLLPLLVMGFASLAFSQISPQDALWSGHAQCQINVQGPGYTHQETHTWTLTGGRPTAQGAMRIYAATWSVTGQGSLQRTQGAQTLDAQWTTNAQTGAPIAVFIRASDGRLLIKSWHAQLRVHDAVTGTQKVTVNGVVQSQAPIGVEAFEWAFPAIEDARTSTSISGSKTMATNGAVGPMQPGGSQGQAACTWQFSKAGTQRRIPAE